MIILQKEMHEISSNVINWMEWHFFCCRFLSFVFLFFAVSEALSKVDTNTHTHTMTRKSLDATVPWVGRSGNGSSDCCMGTGKEQIAWHKIA